MRRLETVNKKVLKAFEHGITPIVCCGESLTQREQGITIDWIRQQIKIAFLNVTDTEPPYWIRIAAAVASS